ncbi:MAG: YIP1 family protein [Candidatus Aenigmarchaeota archaeon]|nr:YIP1 family protein [Candidatus Aenigmarchaeota archaeon]
MDFGVYFNKGMEFLKEPNKAFDSVKKVTIGEAFKYMLVMSVVVAVLNGIITTLLYSMVPAVFAAQMPMQLGPVVLISTIIMSYIGIIVVNLLWSLWLHLWVYILGARKGLEKTMKTVFYAGTPNYLLGWIPFINIVFGVWSLVLSGLGLMRLQEINGGKAALAIIIAIIIPVVILLSVFAFFIAAFLPLMNLGMIS